MSAALGLFAIDNIGASGQMSRRDAKKLRSPLVLVSDRLLEQGEQVCVAVLIVQAAPARPPSAA